MCLLGNICRCERAAHAHHDEQLFFYLHQSLLDVCMLSVGEWGAHPSPSMPSDR